VSRMLDRIFNCEISRRIARNGSTFSPRCSLKVCLISYSPSIHHLEHFARIHETLAALLGGSFLSRATRRKIPRYIFNFPDTVHCVYAHGKRFHCEISMLITIARSHDAISHAVPAIIVSRSSCDRRFQQFTILR